MRFESNGSISSASVIHPSFGDCSGGDGFAPKVSHGEDETSIV